MLRPGDRPLPSAYLPRRPRPPGTSSAAPSPWTGGRWWSSVMSSPARAPWQPGRSPGRSFEGQDGASEPPTSPRAVDGSDRDRGGCAGRCEGARYRRFFRSRCPGVLRKRCGRPMLPEVRSRVPPSTCRPPTITPWSNTCANIGGVVSYERAPKRCPNGPPTGTTPGGRGLDTVHLRDSPAPLGSDRTPHLSVHRLRGGDLRSAPYGATVLRGAVAAETDAGAAATRLERRASRPDRRRGRPPGSRTFSFAEIVV